MNHFSMYCFTDFVGFCFLFFILVLQKSSSAVDHMYEACTPTTCGNVSIRFPFFISGLQESYCGFSEFEVHCDNSSPNPIIHVPENDYVIDSIYYHNQTFRMHNHAACLPQIRNVTEYEHLRFAEMPSLHLLSNCTGQVPEVLEKYRTNPCIDEENREGWSLAMLGDDQNLNFALENCTTNVLAPVEIDGNVESNGGVGYYEGLLRRGFVASWIGGDCSECEKSGGRCGINPTSNQFRCFCTDRPHRESCKYRQKHSIKVIIGATVGGMGLLTCFLLCYLKFKKSSDANTLFLGRKTNEDRTLHALIMQHRSLAPKRYPYSDIKKMTNSFQDKLGQGGYGAVYKGKLLDGRLVAVKILNVAKGNGEEFINEVLSISKTSHVNVVTLLGFCLEGKRRALVYEFMPNGSLEKYIHSKENCNQLGMDKLYQISLGVARGLEYLHRGCNTRILHFDIKPHNILLDEEFRPKISDFGLAKECAKNDSTISMLGARGTIGYIAPELISRNFGGISYKSDVYSYGMMVMEIVGRRKNVNIEISHTSEIYFPHWAYQHLVIDKDLSLKGVESMEEDEIAKKIILVGLWCIQSDPSQRPTMSKVIEMLEGSLQALEIPPKPFFGSPSRSPQTSSVTIAMVS